ncbi:hypothetical protein SODALDRAFT_327588 [Sodiomyces alkalinus F11]|uniref:NADH-ubiquinone reductase complex 1 MLRQ subunit n=1 Tax=Sodiomyces alkalinus (strain CBS 110278 / VKM F-3762 / F11) TaxID=1314773 RepID=A0A3N2Q9Q4_SODAK|nr:hypothetical protein SODALDRAFT_327588 [Sodiomyces alkalinus F11]ROT43388.1 hypothetical protein SODALDRAFT_327588 [Sodiomyces alkalinus F11]
MFRQTARLRSPVPKEDQVGHTVSQRLRKLKNIPPELIPLGLVVAFAVAAGTYSCVRHLTTDSTIRLKRQGGSPTNEALEHH